MEISGFFDTDGFAEQAALIVRYNAALNAAMADNRRLGLENDELKAGNSRLEAELEAHKAEIRGLTHKDAP